MNGREAISELMGAMLAASAGPVTLGTVWHAGEGWQVELAVEDRATGKITAMHLSPWQAGRVADAAIKSSADFADNEALPAAMRKDAAIYGVQFAQALNIHAAAAIRNNAHGLGPEAQQARRA